MSETVMGRPRYELYFLTKDATGAVAAIQDLLGFSYMACLTPQPPGSIISRDVRRRHLKGGDNGITCYRVLRVVPPSLIRKMTGTHQPMRACWHEVLAD